LEQAEVRTPAVPIRLLLVSPL
jgi:hypothetical protein